MKKQVGRVGGPRGERRDRRGGEGKRARERGGERGGIPPRVMTKSLLLLAVTGERERGCIIATSRDGDDHLKEREEREDFCVSRRCGELEHVNN